jgi:predicted metal-dependent enzyme (double-stranded beta helix superfamily)
MLMAIGAILEEDSLGRYLAEVRSLWGDGKEPHLPFRNKSLLEKFLNSVNAQQPWISRLIERGLPAAELYRDKDDGFIFMGHVYDKGRSNPPHDHGPCWVLYGVYHGVMEITTYQRTDDGGTPGRAMLEKKELHRLTPGIVAAFLPGEIHSTFAPEASVVFRFLSGDLYRAKRNRYICDGVGFRVQAAS